MGDIKPIETFYNNYRFRSRLEARHALCYDLLGIRYEYEPEGLVLSDGSFYLPDFYLPDLHCYVEIKRNGLQTTDEGKKAIWKISDGMRTDSWAGLICFGDPLDDNTTLFCQEYNDSSGESYTARATIGLRPDDQSPCIFIPCDRRDRAFLSAFGGESYRIPAINEGYGCYDDFVTERVLQARRTARQARFEHGETPQIKRPGSSGN